MNTKPLTFRPAHAHEFPAVQAFYWKLIDLMQDSTYHPAWEKGVYPADAFLQDTIAAGQMYLLLDGGEILGAMVMNHNCTEGYEQVTWGIDASSEEVSVIHALGIMPTSHGKGLGKRLVQEAIDEARKNHQKAIRLDVLGGNVPAMKLYESMSFVYKQTLQLFYEDTGLTDFLLYELIL